MKEKKNKITLIVTEGCEACNIAENLIAQAIGTTNIDVELEVKDVTDFNKRWLTQNKITDFPTAILTQNDCIRFKFTGTKPAVVISQWIRVHLR